MGKVVNVIDLGGGDYEVMSTKNTRVHKIGKVISESEVDSLMSSGYEVNFKGPKVPNEIKA